jgi:hypothetical protein
VRFANLSLVWRSKEYYASGAEQKALASGVDLAALQSQVTEAGDSFLTA